MSIETIKWGRHERTAPHRTEEDIAADPQPGDVYRTSWGYDQTNSEFFQVVRRTPGTVSVRRIAATLGPDKRLYPVPDEFVDDFQLGTEPKVCRLATRLSKWQKGDPDAKPRMGASLTIDNVRTAWPYDGGGAWDTLAAGYPGH